jgi:selenocysteine-specific elongation factor
MAGFGTIVTGTLSDGNLNVGDDVVILPRGVRGRIRGLQTHKRKEPTAIPGSRTAVNISGVDTDQVQRGDVITHPGAYQATRRLDLQFRLLPDVSQPVKHNMEVKLFIGASEVLGRLRLLGSDILKPGEDGWLQLELTHPVIAVRGDRYILRRPSPGETLGGGVVVDPRPKGRHKRFDQNMLDRLDSLVGGTPAEILLQSMLALGIAPLREMIERSSLEKDIAAQALDELIKSGQALFLDNKANSPTPNDLITSQTHWAQLKRKVILALAGYHQSYPLRRGIPREELKSKLKVSPRIFSAILSKMLVNGDVVEESVRKELPGVSPIPVILQPGFDLNLTSAQTKLADQLLSKFAVSPFSPPTVKDCVAEVGDDIYNALIDLGKLMPVSGEVVFRWEDYKNLSSQVGDFLEKERTITVAQMRDLFNTSRRYVLAFLEHLDAIGMTVRDGDVRKLK